MKFRLLLPLLAALAQSCEDKSHLTAADYTPSEHRHAGAGRLTVDGRLLRLDGRPFLMRGVTYAPTPPGDDPGWVSADYLSSAYTSMHVRDLSLMEQMGLNTIRLYGAGAVEAGQAGFYDMVANRSIGVIGASDYSVPAESDNRSCARLSEMGVFADEAAQLRARLRLHNHSSLIMWTVGNEFNGAWNNWLGSQDELGPDACPSDAGCLFGDLVAELFNAVNALCGIVKNEFGLLCTHVLADVPVPARFANETWATAGDDAARWVELIERHANTSNIDLWGVNTYRGGTFGSLFTDYARASSKPLLVLEYGVDAYDMARRGENEELQAEWTRRLARELEANAATCEAGCASKVTRTRT